MLAGLNGSAPVLIVSVQDAWGRRYNIVSAKVQQSKSETPTANAKRKTPPCKSAFFCCYSRPWQDPTIPVAANTTAFRASPLPHPPGPVAASTTAFRASPLPHPPGPSALSHSPYRTTTPRPRIPATRESCPKCALFPITHPFTSTHMHVVLSTHTQAFSTHIHTHNHPHTSQRLGARSPSA